MLPSVDYTRFNVVYWQKFERMLQYAWSKDMSISAVFEWNDSRVHPVAGSEDELRYYRYAAARLAAFSNINWDLGDDINRVPRRQVGPPDWRLAPEVGRVWPPRHRSSELGSRAAGPGVGLDGLHVFSVLAVAAARAYAGAAAPAGATGPDHPPVQ